MAKQSTGGSGVSEALARYTQVAELQAEMREHVEAIHDLMHQISRHARGNGGGAVGRQARRGRRPGRPRKTARVVRKAKRARAGKRAPRGALKAAIHRVLAGGRAVKPKDIIKSLPKVGFKSNSSPKVLYSTVYISCTKDPKIRKTGAGFQLKAGATKKAAAKKSA